MPGKGSPAGDSAPAPRASAAELEAATHAVREAALDALWRQWAVLGAGAAAAGPARAVVDPEALVLASLWFMDDTPRLADLVASWTVVNTHLLSMQRLKNVAELYPAAARDRVSALARLALERGKDFRWKPLVRQDMPPLVERSGKKLSVAVPLRRPPALVLRLRGLLGVGMRADVVAFLLTDRSDYVSPEDIAAATVYNPTSVRRLLGQLVDAGGLSYAAGTYPGYSIKGSPLARLVGLPVSAVPRWRHVAQVLAFVTEYLQWRRDTRERAVSPFAAAAKGDELFDRHRRAFVDTGLVARHLTAVIGDDWAAHLKRLAEWMQEVI